MSTSQISSAAQRAFTAAAAYDTHRPSYTSSSEADASSSSSSKALQFLLEQTRVAGVQGAHLLDLGAGTGKFTEALAARPENYRITAAEPHAQMREVLAKKDLPGVTVIEGGAEDLKRFVDEESIDAVFAAQVWFLSIWIFSFGFCCQPSPFPYWH
jgi:SAM-dependent methyltransferase